MCAVHCGRHRRRGKQTEKENMRPGCIYRKRRDWSKKLCLVARVQSHASKIWPILFLSSIRNAQFYALLLFFFFTYFTWFHVYRAETAGHMKLTLTLVKPSIREANDNNHLSWWGSNTLISPMLNLEKQWTRKRGKKAWKKRERERLKN